MTKGEIDYAIRQALNNFDEWNDVTGYFNKGTSYYYEIQGVAEDAVRIGSIIACQGLNGDLSEVIDK